MVTLPSDYAGAPAFSRRAATGEVLQAVVAHCAALDVEVEDQLVQPLGQTQARSPSSAITAGTTVMRMMMASKKTAMAIAKPSILEVVSGASMNEANTQIMMIAAEDTTRAPCR